MKKNLIFVTVLLLGLASGFAESSELAFSPKKMSANYDAREKDTFADSEKHYLTAISVMLLDNIFISSWNRFVSKSDWAKVTVDDMLEFYDKKMEWDTDWYWTNFVLHPYQGGLYYQAARSSNLNQLESFGVTVLGSSIWEWFCERNAPSKNDMVYTTVGAFAMGEMFYRLSIEAREINKFFGYAMNPNSMITQLTTGEKTRGTTGNIHELSFKFEMGAARTFTSFEKNYSNDTEVFPGFVAPKLEIVYNDPYGWDSNIPYSQFEFDFGAAIGFGSGEGVGSSEQKIMYNVTLLSNGMLFSRALDFGEKKDTTIGLVFDYDFIWHSFMELTSLSPGAAIKQRIRFDNGSKIEWQFHLDALLLGTTDYYYLRREKIALPEGTYRDYNFTTGGETVFKWKYVSKNGFILNTDFHGYAMYVFSDSFQDFDGQYTGWELIGIETVDFEVPVSSKVNVGFSNQVYLKKTFYSDIPKIFSTVYTASVFAKLKLK